MIGKDCAVHITDWNSRSRISGAFYYSQGVSLTMQQNKRHHVAVAVNRPLYRLTTTFLSCVDISLTLAGAPLKNKDR